MSVYAQYSSSSALMMDWVLPGPTLLMMWISPVSSPYAVSIGSVRKHAYKHTHTIR